MPRQATAATTRPTARPSRHVQASSSNVRRFSKAPVFLEAQAASESQKIPWLGNRKLRLELTS